MKIPALSPTEQWRREIARAVVETNCEASAMTIRDPDLAALYAELQRMAAQIETAKRMVRECDERKRGESK